MIFCNPRENRGIREIPRIFLVANRENSYIYFWGFLGSLILIILFFDYLRELNGALKELNNQFNPIFSSLSHLWDEPFQCGIVRIIWNYLDSCAHHFKLLQQYSEISQDSWMHTYIYHPQIRNRRQWRKNGKEKSNYYIRKQFSLFSVEFVPYR